MEADSGMGLLTCLACQCTFVSSDAQREHYKTEWHRYNLRRKVTGMRPCTLADFEGRLKALQTQTAKKSEMESKGWHCVACRKTYNSENGYTAHTKSKKHVETQAAYEEAAMEAAGADAENDGMQEASTSAVQSGPVLIDMAARKAAAEAKEEAREVPTTLEELHEMKIRNAVKLALEECLFCRKMHKTLDENIDHMTTEHGFFIPDLEFLSDMEGLITYLGEKIGVGNVCLHCNGKGRGFQTLESVQAHMVSKNHCKLADEDFDEEFEDYYDYTEDNTEMQLALREGRAAHIGADGLSLVLPDGTAAGNRTLLRYYKQSYKTDRSERIVNSLLHQYKMLGYETHKKERKHEKKKQHNLQDNKFWMRLGVKANKFQHHFREQIL